MSSSNTKIFIKSIERISGTSSEGVIKTHITLIGNFTIESFVVTNNIYNITSSNNIFYFVENGTDYDLELTPGAYSNPDIACEIQNQLNGGGLSNEYCVEYIANTGKINITIENGTAPFGLRFGSGTTNSSRIILGFDETDTAVDTNDKMSDFPTNINVNYHIFMSILDGLNTKRSVLKYRDEDPNNNWETILHLFNNFKFGDTLTYKDNHIGNYNIAFVRDRSMTSPDEFHFSYRFHDNNNDLISLNGAEWEMVLQRTNLRKR